VRLLLDTHALLWALSTPEKLSQSARLALEESAHEVWVSSVSFFEIATKVRSGKLLNPGTLLTNWDLTLSRLSAKALPLTVPQAILAGALDLAHRDPFDRLLGAQAIDLDLQLVSCNTAFAEFPNLTVLW